MGLRTKHGVVRTPSGPEAVACIREGRIESRLQHLQQGLLDEAVKHRRDTLVKLHSYPTSLWDWLRSSTHFIRCVVNGLSS